MKQKIAWSWQNAENMFLVLFFLTFTFNIRKVFLTPFSYLNGGFNEYTTIFFAWTDVLMISTILIYTTKYLLRQFRERSIEIFSSGNNTTDSSSLSFPLNVSRETFILLICLAWSGLSIFWSPFQAIAIYRFIGLLEIAIFTYITIKALKIDVWRKFILLAIIIDAIFQSILAIIQFILNRSLGLHILGESLVSPSVDGTAKLVIDGGKHIRAYGTMPHPNILAGFLLIVLFFLIAASIYRYKKVSHETPFDFVPGWILYGALSIVGIGYILTFSRSAFLGLIVGLAAFVALQTSLGSFIEIIKRNTKLLRRAIVVLILATIVLITKTSLFSSQSLQERNRYQNVSYETILNHPLRGIGIGQTVIKTYYAHPNFENWQYQPVHNIYLLIFGELGIIGFILFSLYIILIVLNMCREEGKISNLTRGVFCGLVLSSLIISFFDHYFWDIKLGTIILVLPFIFCAESLRICRNRKLLDRYL
ncbi:MAG TPA: O-antigen ligase family protein [Candidatus Bathyarchaeia archaeon]|nr:O-antigen ligase family protein [Candidatus Bathyarchaeia archaeon]